MRMNLHYIIRLLTLLFPRPLESLIGYFSQREEEDFIGDVRVNVNSMPKDGPFIYHSTSFVYETKE